MHIASKFTREIIQWGLIGLFCVGVAPAIFAVDGEDADPGSIKGNWFIHQTKGFKFKIPDGFERHARPGTSLYLEAKEQSKYENIKFQPAISVSAFGQPSYIDEQTATDPKLVISISKIVNYYEKLFNIPGGYEILSTTIQKFRTDTDALLIYGRFRIDEVPIIQGHLIISGEERTFLISYTDIEESFEDNYEHIYDALTKITFEGQAPVRPSLGLKIAKVAIPFFMMVLLYYFFVYKPQSALENIDVVPPQLAHGTGDQRKPLSHDQYNPETGYDGVAKFAPNAGDLDLDKASAATEFKPGSAAKDSEGLPDF